MAFKKRRRASAAPRKRRRRTTVTVGRRRTRRRSVGAVGATHHSHRRSRRMGSTGGSFKALLEMAGGIAAGAIVTHMALRPLEKKIAEHSPMAVKFMGAGEILLGFFVAQKAKNAILRGAGWGIMSAGVHTVMHQFNIGEHSPAISGPGDYSEVRVPISGNLKHLINGSIIEDRLSPTRTSYVAGGGEMGSSSMDLMEWESRGNTNMVAGPEDENWLDPIGYNY